MSAAESEVTRVVTAFAEAWNRHDMVAFSKLFAVNAEFVNVVGMWWKGRAEIKAAHEHTHSNIFKNSCLTIQEVTVRFPVPQIAIARWKWRLENHVSPDGGVLPPRTGVMINVLALQDDQWLIIDAQNAVISADEIRTLGLILVQIPGGTPLAEVNIIHYEYEARLPFLRRLFLRLCSVRVHDYFNEYLSPKLCAMARVLE